MNNPNAIISSDYGPIIINTNDFVIAKAISRDGYWAINDINLIKELISFQLTQRESITFFDIGANIGTHSLALSKNFKNSIKIRAFEAQRQVFNMLCGTVAINGLTNVFCHNNAISEFSSEFIEINLPNYHEKNNFGAFELIPPINSDNAEMIKSGSELIETINIDSFNEEVNFMKIDIEGMEDKAIRGASTTLSRYRPICFIEIHKTNSQFITDFFQAMNYRAYLRSIDLILIPQEIQLEINNSQRLF